MPKHAEVTVRPMQLGDLESAERASSATFLEAERLVRRASDPQPQQRSSVAVKHWIDRMGHFLTVDGGGCWVAVDGPQVVGFAISQNRGGLWYLATYGVLPDYQGIGVGRRLMDAVLQHAADRPGMLISTIHPGATRRYRLAGFTLYPLMRLVGVVDRSAIPAIRGLRDGLATDFGWMDRLDTKLRGAGHGPDHPYMLKSLRLVVSPDPDRLGYAYVDERGRPMLLAAARRETARRLLWEAFASSVDETLVNCITTANHWAVDIGLKAGLAIGQEGYLAIRKMRDPSPYLASGHFL
jgi:GNAT superfamily N-acetyltransferase